jgi:UDP-N-acetylglucosamine--N-acetylmuramyl-(pentapeptide) pyrophosphoryl-undecaprenol N-acetylglucosamine transferase
MNKQLKVLLSGGGTGGSVTPVLAVADEIKKQNPNVEFLWVGTKNGIERKMVKAAGVEFKAIASGKLRRYFSLHNIVDIAKIKFGFFQSLLILRKWQPDAIFTAGAYVSVPLVWAARVFKIPVIIHQLDIRAGLANKLMSKFAQKITVGFDEASESYDADKVIVTGNPIRQVFLHPLSYADSLRQLSLEQDRPVVLILGGGTGAAKLNTLITESLPELLKFTQIVHLTGGKGEFVKVPGYHAYNFLKGEQYVCALKAADIVVTRAGMGTLSELATMAKTCIVVPLPKSHQEDNAKFFSDKKAALYLNQNDLTPQKLSSCIKSLLEDSDEKKVLSSNINKLHSIYAATKIAEIIINI